MSKDKVVMKDEAIQTDILNTTTSSKGSHHSSPKSNEFIENKDIVKVEHSHKKAQEYLESNFESIDYAIAKQVYEILDKAIYSALSAKDNIVQAIDKVEKIDLIKTETEKKVAVLELLESFYNKYNSIREEKEVEDTFVEALSYIHEDKGLQGFIEDIYADYFE
jgi:hypothetical protein